MLIQNIFGHYTVVKLFVGKTTLEYNVNNININNYVKYVQSI